MPRLSSFTEERRATVAAVVATELSRSRLLWSQPTEPWYARRRAEDPWLTGHAATQIRDMLIVQEVAKLSHEQPYSSWPELRGYFMHRSSAIYDLHRRLRWIWSDWGRPEDLPES